MTNQPVTGTVFDIQHFSVSDGPGIRTVVFLKGCPLRCAWCHNPESYIFRPQVMAYKERCAQCGACAAACPQGLEGIRALTTHWREGCSGCGACAAACPTGAIDLAGQTMTVAQVMEEVLGDEMFYQTSSGGMTLSGGEPMAQFDFALALAQAAKAAGLHVCMETSGHCPAEKLMGIRPYIDLFLYDYKLTGEEAHRRYTGVGQKLILENLRRLDESGSPTILRCPMIPGVNIHEEHTQGIIHVAGGLKHLRQIHLEPYHSIGLSKRARLGMDAEDGIVQPNKAQLTAMAEAIAAATGRETLVM